MAATAGLILTASREHRDYIITAVPSAFKRVFTMKEFARLVTGRPPSDPVSAVTAAAAARGRSGPVLIGDDDVGDPYRGTVEYAKAIAEQISETVHSVVYAMGLATQSWDEVQAARAYRPRHTRPVPS